MDVDLHLVKILWPDQVDEDKHRPGTICARYLDSWQVKLGIMLRSSRTSLHEMAPARSYISDPSWKCVPGDDYVGKTFRSAVTCPVQLL